MPAAPSAQILWTIAGLEHASECLDPAGHYTKGGEPGNLKFLKRCALCRPCRPSPHSPRSWLLARSVAAFA